MSLRRSATTIEESRRIFELTKLRSLYKENAALKLKSEEYQFHIVNIFLHFMAAYVGPAILSSWAYRLKYDIYEARKLSALQVGNHKKMKELMVNMTHFLSDLLNEKQNITELKNLSVQKLGDMIGQYWSTCRKKFYIPDIKLTVRPQDILVPDYILICMNVLRRIGPPIYSASTRLYLYYDTHLTYQNRIKKEIGNDITLDEIKIQFKKLQDENADLHKSIYFRNNLKNVFYLFFIIPLAVYLFLEDKLKEDITILFISSFVVPFVMDSIRDLVRYIGNIRFKEKLNQAETNITQCLPTILTASISSHQGTFLDSSYIKISFGEFENLSDKKVCRIVKSVLLSHGFPLIDCDGNSLNICANASISDKEIKVINQHIQQAIVQYKEAYLLRKQLLDLCHRYKLKIVTIPESEKGLVTMTFHITCSNLNFFNSSFGIAFYNKIQSAFINCKIVMQNNDLIIVGHTPAEEKSLQNIYPNESSSTFYDPFDNPASFPKKGKKGDEPPPKTPKRRNQPSTNEEKDENIQEEDTSIQTPPPSCNVLKGTDFANDVYIKNELDPKHFGRHQTSYKNFKSMIEDPYLAPRRRGTQGFIFIDSDEQDFNGKYFHAFGMFKRKGDQGDERVFCSKETINGKTVYVPRGYNPHTHPSKKNQ